MKTLTLDRAALSAALSVVALDLEADGTQYRDRNIVDCLLEVVEQQEREKGLDRVYPPFAEMVKTLFKQMPEAKFASLLHAVLGITGEAGELLVANSRKNTIEECGDLEFYIFALLQCEEMWKMPPTDVPNDMRGLHLTLTNIPTNIVGIACDMLDIAKKSWVYGKELKPVEMHTLLAALLKNLHKLYEIMGLTVAEVRHANQVKLIGPGGRFESGFYSDGAAIARADKAGEVPADTIPAPAGQPVPACAPPPAVPVPEPVRPLSADRKFFGNSL